MADEALEIITRLWTEDEVTYQGRFNRLENVRFDPKPIQKPYPPIWWGGPGSVHSADREVPQ